MGPPFRPHGKGDTYPCARGATGALHTLQQRDKLSNGEWGERRGSWVLSRLSLHTRTTGSPARTSPLLLSLCLPHQAPSTYPLSRHSRGASITPGTTHAILARVPRLPLPGKGTVVRGYCAVPRVHSAGAVCFRGGRRGMVSK